MHWELVGFHRTFPVERLQGPEIRQRAGGPMPRAIGGPVATAVEVHAQAVDQIGIARLNFVAGAVNHLAIGAED